MIHNGEEWTAKQNGFYFRQSGDMRLLVENTCVGFRVLVARVSNDKKREQVVFTGSADSVSDALRTADREARRFSGRQDRVSVA